MDDECDCSLQEYQKSLFEALRTNKPFRLKLYGSKDYQLLSEHYGTQELANLVSETFWSDYQE